MNRLVAFVPMRAEDAAVDAAGVGAGRAVLAAAPRAVVDAALQPFVDRGTLPARLEPAGVACVRLLKRIAADEGPRASALALLGTDVDRYVALDAAGIPAIVRASTPDRPPPDEWLAAARTCAAVYVTGPDATRRLDYLKTSCGLAGARLWTPPGGEPSAAETYAADLPGAPTVDLIPAEVRGRVNARRRAGRLARAAAAIVVAGLLAGAGAVWSAEATRRRAADRLERATEARRAFDGPLTDLCREIATVEAEAATRTPSGLGAIDGRPARGSAAPVAALLAAVIEAAPEGVALDEARLSTDRPTATGRFRSDRFAALRPSDAPPPTVAAVVVSGRAPSLETVKDYRAALAAHADVGAERLVRADIGADGVRFEIEAAGAGGPAVSRP